MVGSTYTLLTKERQSKLRGHVWHFDVPDHTLNQVHAAFHSQWNTGDRCRLRPPDGRRGG